MTFFVATVDPGKSVGFFVLGTSLHDVIARIKSEPALFTKLDLIFDDAFPVTVPVVLELPANGIRLRFDGPSQILRLIEIVDFTRNKLQYAKDKPQHATRDIFKSDGDLKNFTGPDFKHVYTLFGPTFPGEYSTSGESGSYGTYVHSYPGLAFTFPIFGTAWSDGKDHVELLSSSATLPATSMAVYHGDSWPDVRNHLFTMLMPDPVNLFPPTKNRDVVAEEISLVKVLGGGCLELQCHRSGTSMLLKLGYTTPQDLVAQLGPPDAIYRRTGEGLAIHKARTKSEALQARPQIVEDSTTTRDHMFGRASTDVSDHVFDDGSSGSGVAECFYNYFYQGFDVLMASPAIPSQPPPSQGGHAQEHASNAAPIVATKVVLHCNVPGSYSFQRHRRSRWEISYVTGVVLNSETPYHEIATVLHKEWKSIYDSEEEATSRQRGMVLNRGWGDSPGSSCEFIGGWEESAGGRRADDDDEAIAQGASSLGNTTLYGFPGLVFEVLKNGFVSGLTVF